MEAIGGVKIFAMNDCDWYVGKDADDALKGMAENLGCKDVEECRSEYCIDGPIVELGEDELDARVFVDEDLDGENQVKRTFREQLSLMVAEGDTFPCMFASTEF